MNGEHADHKKKQKKRQESAEQPKEKSSAMEKEANTEQAAAENTSPEKISRQSGTGDRQQRPSASGQDPVQLLSSMTHEERRLFLSAAGLSTFFKSTGRLFWTNFLMGLARGIGFVIGMSILGVLCVAVWNEFLSVTGIGEFIARLIEEVHKHIPASP